MMTSKEIMTAKPKNGRTKRNKYNEKTNTFFENGPVPASFSFIFSLFNETATQFYHE